MSAIPPSGSPVEGNIRIEPVDDCDDNSKGGNSSGEQRRVWESPDFTITKIVIAEGDRLQSRPRFGATCQVAISGVSCGGAGISLDEITNDFFFSKYFNRLHSGEVQIGGADSELDKTLERCIQSMYPGEDCEASLRVRMDLVRNRPRRKEGKAQPEEVWIEVECRLHLETLLNAQPIHKWYAETKFEKAKEANSAAVRLFKTQRFLDAFHKFHLTLTLLTFVLEEEGSKAKDKVDPEVVVQAEEMRLTCYSNLAACQFQWGNHAYVVELSSKVLDLQRSNVKLLYRRGVSYLEMKDFDSARADLIEAHRLDPSNRAINDKLGQLRVMEKKHKDQVASGMKKMFG